MGRTLKKTKKKMLPSDYADDNDDDDDVDRGCRKRGSVRNRVIDRKRKTEEGKATIQAARQEVSITPTTTASSTRRRRSRRDLALKNMRALFPNKAAHLDFRRKCDALIDLSNVHHQLCQEDDGDDDDDDGKEQAVTRSPLHSDVTKVTKVKVEDQASSYGTTFGWLSSLSTTMLLPPMMQPSSVIISSPPLLPSMAPPTMPMQPLSIDNSDDMSSVGLSSTSTGSSRDSPSPSSSSPSPSLSSLSSLSSSTSV